MNIVSIVFTAAAISLSILLLPLGIMILTKAIKNKNRLHGKVMKQP